MGQFILFVVLGLAAGAIYAVLAASLASIYLASGVINFAQGSIALWAVWATAQLRENGVLVLPVGSLGLTSGTPMGSLAAVAIGSACGLAWAGLAYLIVFRPLRRAPMLSQVVASVGLMLLIQALVTLRFDTESTTAAPILTNSSVRIAGAAINVSNLILCLLAVVVSLALWAYFRFTRAGVATRAAAEDERGVRLMGYAPDRLAGLTWLLAGVASTMVPVLASPTVGLDSLSYMYYVIPALAAALLGRLEQQMLALAKAMLAGPRVLLIDEMSLGLAPIAVQRMLPTIRDLADRRGVGVVLVEQHIGLALSIADRALVLHHGRVALTGTAAQLRGDPRAVERAYFGLSA